LTLCRKVLNLSSDKVIVTTFFNKMLEKLDFAGNYWLLDEVMILPATIIGLLAYNWRTFSTV